MTPGKTRALSDRHEKSSLSAKRRSPDFYWKSIRYEEVANVNQAGGTFVTGLKKTSFIVCRHES